MTSFYEDTHPLVEKKHLELLKGLTTTEQLKKTLEMTSWLLWLSKKAIAKANPLWSPQTIDLFFVKNYYGEKLAQRLERYLEKKHDF